MSTFYFFKVCIFLCLSVISFLKIVIYLAALSLSCGTWDLVSWPGTEPGPPALGVWSFSHWSTREILLYFSF